jgi:transposase-like protein
MGDARILGSGQFVQEMLAQVQGMVKYQLTPVNTANKINRELEKMCKGAGITKELLQSGSRRHPLPPLRKKLACQFVMKYGLSLAETARMLGVSTSAVARMLERHE